MSQNVKPVSPSTINAFFTLLTENDFFGKCSTTVERDIRSLNISLIEQLQTTANPTELDVALMCACDQSSAEEEMEAVAEAFRASGWIVEWVKDVVNHDKARDCYIFTFTSR